VSETVSAPNRLFWLASGNNLEFGGDILRRTIHVRLESDLENPEARKGFRHSPLLPWITKERPRLVVAALTILRGFLEAGCPDERLSTMGSFEEWSGIVAGAVVWIGLPDPQSTRVDLDVSADREKSTLAVLIDALAAACEGRPGGVTAKELLEAAGADARLTHLRDVLEDLPGNKGKTVGARELGDLLRRSRRRVVRGRRIDSRPDRTNVARWYVESVGA
jgi:hypothetical protein